MSDLLRLLSRPGRRERAGCRRLQPAPGTLPPLVMGKDLAETIGVEVGDR